MQLQTRDSINGLPMAVQAFACTFDITCESNHSGSSHKYPAASAPDRFQPRKASAYQPNAGIWPVVFLPASPLSPPQLVPLKAARSATICRIKDCATLMLPYWCSLQHSQIMHGACMKMYSITCFHTFFHLALVGPAVACLCVCDLKFPIDALLEALLSSVFSHDPPIKSFGFFRKSPKSP